MISPPREAKPGWLLYDSKDLVTHAVCVGMTGSGKTGLCLSLLEEAAIDNIPAIIIDPKGDLGNLMLTFPHLRGEDFQPWINEDDARKKGLSSGRLCPHQAELWKKGLAGWQQDGARIQRLRDAADVAIYTPGSNAGLPVSILKSFAAPPAEMREDAELLRERISATVTSLLGLLGIEADPIQSREHILLSTILDQTWKKEEDLDLAALIQAIQSPPSREIGVMDHGILLSRRRIALPRDEVEQSARVHLGFRPGWKGSPRHPVVTLHACGKATVGDFLHRAFERCRAHVLRYVVAQPNGRMDEGAVGHDQPARAYSTWTKSSDTFRRWPILLRSCRC